ncbi:hypothetical protein C7S18_20225 [Ahniella affigens]|uniref:Uncharacterized protein n=1 Tax=Ahniella affigens TaxID=2021234 RepID=A0A2P1PX21_9GAMM|nr:hypothetical protein [Ahniella affigens]AVP99354.1 hypothetical protein C7S18_20225 [Ahniella affigens]
MTDQASKLTTHQLAGILAGDQRALLDLSHADDIRALKLALATEPLAQTLAQDVARVQAGSWFDRLQTWWREAGMPPVLAAAAIGALAIGAFWVRAPEHASAPAMAAQPSPDTLFVAAFDEQSDTMFGGAFEQAPTVSVDQMFGGGFDG